MKKMVLVLALVVLLTSAFAFNSNREYCGKFSVNKDCHCKEGEFRIQILIPEGTMLRFAYAYCEKENGQGSSVSTKLWGIYSR